MYKLPVHFADLATNTRKLHHCTMKLLYNKNQYLILSSIKKMYNNIQTYSSTSRLLIDCLDKEKNKIQKVQENPPVYQLATKAAADRCLDILRRFPDWHTGFVGFDTETTVYRQKDPQVVSMIQIATRELCFLFQVFRITKINNTKFPPLLQEILTNQDIKKVGVNASGDANWIKKSYGFEMRGMVDLEKIAQQKGYAARSLRELTRMFGDPGLVLEKSRKILKWNFDAVKLDLEVIRYASSDAFAGIQVYESILKDRINEEYLNYEKRYPMSMKEEDDEIYSLILESHPKGVNTRTKTIANSIENHYQRWFKTKPKTDDRHKAALNVIGRFIEDGRLIKVLGNTDSNSDEQNEKKISSISMIRLPGVPFNKILKDFGKEFFESKGLPQQDSEFMTEISSYCLKAIKKESLAKNIANNSKITSLDRKNRDAVIAKLNELNRKGALMSGQKNNTLLLHPDWVNGLEDGYEKFKLTHDVEDERVENETSKEGDSDNENLEGRWEQNEQTYEPWQDITTFDPSDVWGNKD
ncbi:3'-5' exonuclease domain-containing protein 2 [Rhizophagus irregularis DAOM 181602=DAOM 197198]|nr:3'-5' exonuclease domain-containing protein 2 [Rhizophagus irregularis DAOM 181602=DAOM 197198]